MRSFLFLTLILIFTDRINAGDLSVVKHIVIIGVDGMSPDGIQKASTPNMDKLVETGAHSFTAQAVLPTSSSPNWASMIMGVPPEMHGVKSNSWKARDARKKAFCGNGKGEIWPTIYRVIREQRKDAVIACFHDWLGYGRLIESRVCNVKKNCIGEDRTVNSSIRYIGKKKPLFTFIHLDHVDHAGHQFGHGTTEYYQSVEKADSLIGEVISILKNADIFENTMILVTSDHGGKGKGHGGDTPEERTIPWIISGQVFKREKL